MPPPNLYEYKLSRLQIKNPMITDIFVDMDGVLSNFKDKFKQVYNSEPLIHYPGEEVTISQYKNYFRNFVLDGYFNLLDPMPDFKLGFTFLQTINNSYNVNILSSTAREEFLDELTYQKTQWLNRYNINFPAIFVPGKHLKQNYSGPGKVLIDDTELNIQQWIDKGGIGIYHKSWIRTIDELTHILG